MYSKYEGTTGKDTISYIVCMCVVPGFYLLGGGGGRGGSSPPKCQSSSPNIFIRFGKTLPSNSHTLAINFLSAINKVQSSKLCHRLSINRSC